MRAFQFEAGVMSRCVLRFLDLEPVEVYDEVQPTACEIWLRCNLRRIVDGQAYACEKISPVYQRNIQPRQHARVSPLGGMEMRIWLRFKESREQLYRGIHWDDYPEFDAVVDYNVIDSSNGDSVLGFRVCWGRP